MENAKHGDLSALMKLPNIQLEQKLVWFTQICLAVDAIHDAKIIHRDLKPMNIFIDSFGFIKIGDFGVSKAVLNATKKVSTIAGTYEYMAPEVIQEELYDNKIDIWSLGVILYELVCGFLPFEGKNFILMSNIISKEPKRFQMMFLKP